MSISARLVSFSPSGELLAHCDDLGILSIWNAKQGFLYPQSGSLGSSSYPTCLSFNHTDRKSKKRKSGTVTSSLQELIAVGTAGGSVLVYSIPQKKVVSKLQHSSTDAVTAVCWKSSNVLYSLGKDKKVVIWNTDDQKRLGEVKVEGSSAMCFMGNDTLLVAEEKIYALNVANAKKARVTKEFSGHTHPVTLLAPVRKKKGNIPDMFLSSSCDENTVYAWNLVTSQASVCFPVKRPLMFIHCGYAKTDDVTLLLGTTRGHLYYIHHHFNGVKFQNVEVKQNLRIKTASTSASDDVASKYLPILCAHLSVGGQIQIAYGRPPSVKVEKIEMNLLKKEKTCLERQDPAENKADRVSGLVQTVTPLVDSHAFNLVFPEQVAEQVNEEESHLPDTTPDEHKGVKRKGGAEAQPEDSLSMEKRLQKLTLQTGESTEKKKAISGNLSRLLIQGLRSDDERVIEKVLRQGKDEEVVESTVKNLPLDAVIPLLNLLQSYMLARRDRQVYAIQWFKSILLWHMSHLSSNPDRETLFKPFLIASEGHLEALKEVLQLHGRLNTLITQVFMRYVLQSESYTTSENILEYNDDSSDEENVAESMHSESDEWQEWSEEEEDKEAPAGNNFKRKLSSASESDNISQSDKDDEFVVDGSVGSDVDE